MRRAVSFLLLASVLAGLFAAPVSAVVSPSESLGVATGKAFRAGWYEDISSDCDNVRGAPASLFGTVTGGSGDITMAGGVGLLGATSSASATSFGAQVLGTIGTGGAAVTAAQVGAVVATGVTGFCSGLLGLQWITGQSPYVPISYTGPFFSYYDSVIPCAQITGLTSAWEDGGSMCMRFNSGSGNYSKPYAVNSFGEDTSVNGWSWNYNLRLWKKQTNGYYSYAGNISTGYAYTPNISDDLILELNCRSAALCAGDPNSSAGGSLVFGRGELQSYDTVLVKGEFLNSGSVPERLEARGYCVSPFGETQLHYSVGDWSAGGVGTAPGISSDICPSGWLKITYSLFVVAMQPEFRRACGASALPACVDLASIPYGGYGTQLVSWVIPSYVQSNPVLRQCYLEGFTNCEASTSANGVTTVTNTVTTQTTNVTTVNPTVTVDDALVAIGNAVQTYTPPTTVPVTTTPTTVPVTTTTVSVSPPTTIPVTDPTSPPPPPQDEAAWGSCMEDQLAGNDVSVGWDFWQGVKYVVRWMVAPIICAVFWLVVPPGGWGALWDMFAGGFAELPVYAAFTDAISSLAFDELGCQTLDFRPQIGAYRFGSASIDVALCTSFPLQLVWYFFIGLGTLGVLYSGVRSLTSLSHRVSSEPK